MSFWLSEPAWHWLLHRDHSGAVFAVTLSILSKSTWPSGTQWAECHLRLTFSAEIFSRFLTIDCLSLGLPQDGIFSPFDTLCPWSSDEYSHLIAIQAGFFYWEKRVDQKFFCSKDFLPPASLLKHVFPWPVDMLWDCLFLLGHRTCMGGASLHLCDFQDWFSPVCRPLLDPPLVRSLLHTLWMTCQELDCTLECQDIPSQLPVSFNGWRTCWERQLVAAAWNTLVFRLQLFSYW